MARAASNFFAADLADHPGHQEPRQQEDDQADLQQEAAQLQTAADRLLHVLQQKVLDEEWAATLKYLTTTP